jgi:hypothetical protein
MFLHLCGTGAASAAFFIEISISSGSHRVGFLTLGWRRWEFAFPRDLREAARIGTAFAQELGDFCGQPCWRGKRRGASRHGGVWCGPEQRSVPLAVVDRGGQRYVLAQPSRAVFAGQRYFLGGGGFFGSNRAPREIQSSMGSD